MTRFQLSDLGELRDAAASQIINKDLLNWLDEAVVSWAYIATSGCQHAVVCNIHAINAVTATAAYLMTRSSDYGAT